MRRGATPICRQSWPLGRLWLLRSEWLCWPWLRQPMTHQGAAEVAGLVLVKADETPKTGSSLWAVKPSRVLGVQRTDMLPRLLLVCVAFVWVSSYARILTLELNTKTPASLMAVVELWHCQAVLLGGAFCALLHHRVVCPAALVAASALSVAATWAGRQLAVRNAATNEADMRRLRWVLLVLTFIAGMVPAFQGAISGGPSSFLDRSLPAIFVILSAATAGSFAITWLRSKQNAMRRRLGICVYCGYNLTGSPGRCSECGHERG